MYKDNLVCIAKRENNTKRNYLVINRYQGKHIPVEPQNAFSMFADLAKLLKEQYQKERLLFIGFAETATAIGESLAATLNVSYMQTTREHIPKVDYLYFLESHSHATEQRLVKNDLDCIIDKIERIVFIEDEVTTGNTILNIIRLIQDTYKNKVKFAVASLLNGMNIEAQQLYHKKNIDILYLVKTNHNSYTEIAQNFLGDGIYHRKKIEPIEAEIEEIQVFAGINARRLHQGSAYQAACEKVWKELNQKISIEKSQKILVLGTEEFMYPALYIAYKMQEMGKDVKCHSTTRSPIVVSKEDSYPLQERYELISLYEKDRTTYIYNLSVYDSVFIITDADCKEKEGLYSLYYAISSCGNKNINLIRWC